MNQQHPIRTRQQYRKLVEETIRIFSSLQNSYPDDTMYQNILIQIRDIKEQFIDSNQATMSMLDYLERYSLGATAVREFDEGDEMRQRLIDIFGMALKYHDLPER